MPEVDPDTDFHKSGFLAVGLMFEEDSFQPYFES